MKDRANITRVTVDLTLAQRAALDDLIAQANQTASAATGLPIRIGTRQFFHLLLKRYAESQGIDWPDDYPTPGGYRERKPRE